MAKIMEHLSEFVFINVANMTLTRWDAYLAHVKAGNNQDTLSALRQALLPTLFPDQILKKAEEDIAQHEKKGHSSHSSPSHKNDHYHPYHRPKKSREQKSGKPAWKTIGSYRQKRKGKSSQYSTVASDLPVGARRHQFWKTWKALRAGPKTLKMLKEGYSVPDTTKLDKVTKKDKLVCQSPTGTSTCWRHYISL